MFLRLKVLAVALPLFTGCFPVLYTQDPQSAIAALDPEERNGLWWDATEYGRRAGGIVAMSGSDEVRLVTITNKTINHALERRRWRVVGSAARSTGALRA